MAEISISLSGLDDLAKTLTDFEKRVSDATKNPEVLKRVGLIIANSAKERITDGRISPPLAASTKRKKLKDGYSDKPLLRKGLLRQSLSFEVRSNELYMTAIEYGIYHQFGGKGGKPPVRPFIIIDSENLADIEGVIRRYLLGSP